MRPCASISGPAGSPRKNHRSRTAILSASAAGKTGSEKLAFSEASPSRSVRARNVRSLRDDRRNGACHRDDPGADAVASNRWRRTRSEAWSVRFACDGVFRDGNRWRRIGTRFRAHRGEKARPASHIPADQYRISMSQQGTFASRSRRSLTLYETVRLLSSFFNELQLQEI